MNSNTVTDTNSTFNNNTAIDGHGGAIYNQDSLTITNGTFTNNTSIEGGAIYNFIKVTELDPFNYQIVGMLNVTDSKLLNNNATFGGAIYNLCSEEGFMLPVNNICVVNVNFNSIIGNTASNGTQIYNTEMGNIAVSTINATDNWWGTDNPNTSGNDIVNNGGTCNYDPWNIYPPIAGFTVDQPTGTAPQTVNFTDESSGNVSTYNWDFGDESQDSAEQNPVHTYSLGGTYSVTETVTGPGGSNSTTSTVIITPDTSVPVANASLQSGIFNSNQTVTLTATDNDPNLEIYYTLNGTSPTINSTLYTGPLTISTEGTTTLEFIAEDTAGNISNTVTKNYTIDTIHPTASANTITGLYNTTKNITLTMSEPGTIYYTTDGTTPTTSSNVYSEPIIVNKNTTLRYIAVDDAGNVSSIYTQTYTIDKTIPTASVNVKAGLYNTNKVVTVTMSEPGKIYYTLNGTTPTSISTLYTKPITITSTTTLKYLAIDLASNKSSTYVQNYVIDKTAPKIIKTNPKYYAINVPLKTPLTITFSENILKGINYNDIYVKNLKTGKLVHITKTLSKNTLIISMTKTRLHNDKYIIYIPKNAFKDQAGNIITTYTIPFKTG